MKTKLIVEAADLIATLKAAGNPQAARRVARAAIKAGVKVIEKQMKRDVPAKYRALRRIIGSRVLVGGKQETAKVGVAVGKKRSAVAKLRQKLKEQRAARENKTRGVGINTNNAHWFILGTAQRKTKSGHRTGKMNSIAPNLAKVALITADDAALAAMGAAAEKAIAKLVKDKK